jgi:hypothetical protein
MTYQQQYYQLNAEKIKDRVRQWRIDNPARRKASEIDGHLRRKYGISIEVYEEMAEQQGFGCAICGKIPEKRVDKRGRIIDRLYTDHLDTVRGLLCKDCNTGLGCFLDNPILLEIAKVYVECA